MKKAIYPIVLNLIDFIATTYFIVNYGGISIEINPIGRIMYSSVLSIILTKIILVNLLILLISHYYDFFISAKLGYWLASIAYTAVCVYHGAIVWHIIF